ncbi:MAG: F-box-like domain-containing protein [Kistimonas sp.]|nr:F-box-like domain-containing protein [Kistimonas sp.]
MNSLADSRPVPRRSPAAPTPSDEQHTAGQAAGTSGQLACDRSLSARPVSAPSLAREHSTLPASQHTRAPRSLAQNLPALALGKIFRYLSISEQGRCARVCRHWHDCLLSSRARLDHWLKEELPVWHRENPLLGQGFNSRTRPFLQATNSPLLSMMTTLHEESPEPRQATQAQQPGDCDLLSRLVHYALHRQLTRADRLRVPPANINGQDPSLCENFHISPCSRWLALKLKRHAQAPAFLRIYGWKQGDWQQQLLVSGEAEPLQSFRFTAIPQDTLITTRGPDLRAWRREAGTHNWHSSCIHSVQPSYNIRTFFSMANGDQHILSQSASECYIQFTSFSGDDSGWEPAGTVKYSGHPSARTNHPRLSQLALGCVAERLGPDYWVNNIDIWYKQIKPGSPEEWICQASELPYHNSDIRQLYYSPGGNWLLGMLACGRVCLWAQDAQCRLEERLTLPGCVYQPPLYLSQTTPFSSDGRQLALPCSLREVQLCYSDADGHWRCGERLTAPPRPAAPPINELRSILLTPSGNTLVLSTFWSVDVWHRGATGDWQHSLQRGATEQDRFVVQACLLRCGELVCTTAQDPALSLWIHGPDSQGRLVRKACVNVPLPLISIHAASPDGLTVLLGHKFHQPQPLQLAIAQDAETTPPALQQHPAGLCRYL